jgi:hypothetical protein
VKSVAQGLEEGPDGQADAEVNMSPFAQGLDVNAMTADRVRVSSYCSDTRRSRSNARLGKHGFPLF